MTQREMKEGFEFILRQCGIIAQLPLEEWLAAISRAETMGPFVDPTLYREYIHSEKAKLIVKVIKAALPLKQLLLEAQPLILEELRKELGIPEDSPHG